MANENQGKQLQIELKPEVACGTYANLAVITHSSSEVILDFIGMFPGMPKAEGQYKQVRGSVRTDQSAAA